MKRKTFVRSAIAAAFVGFVFCFGAQAANGSYDLRFQLFDAATEGAARTTRIILEDVLITNGEKFSIERFGKNGNEFQKSTELKSDFTEVGQTQAAALATFTVTNTQDSGAGSLRQAILNANQAAGADTITIDTTGTVNLLSALPDLSDVTISGPGARQFKVERSSAAGTPQFRIFFIPTNTTVTISGLTVAGGDTNDNGGGIYSGGTLTINGVVVSGNKSALQGGGIYARRSTNTGNSNDNSFTANNCSIVNNQGNGKGDGIAFYNQLGTTRAVLTNCTISGNTIRSGVSDTPTRFDSGSVYVDTLNIGAYLDLYNCTVAGNQFGVLMIADSSGMVTRYKNSILDDGIYESGGRVTLSGGYNIINFEGPDSRNGNTGQGDITNVDARLAALGDYGGQVPTHALLFDSPAIDSCLSCTATNDARGLARNVDGDGNNSPISDIGAFEGQKYTVTNTNDTGAGSLRQAILDNNAAGGGLIAFNIAGGGVKTIAPAIGALPENTRHIDINGYTQPGATANTLAEGGNANLLIELSGQNLSATGEGIRFSASHSRVRGLAIGKFGGSGVLLRTDLTDAVVQGNYVGLPATGTAPFGNGDGVAVEIFSDVLIGTDGDNQNDYAERNVISGNQKAGIRFRRSSSGNVAAGNYIGTNPAGTAAVPNEIGVYIFDGARNNRIGTAGDGIGDANETNVISGNRFGVTLEGDDADGNRIAGNYIGTSSSGLALLANTENGISITDGSSGNFVGGAQAAQRNIIARSTNAAIRLENADTVQNTISNNYIGVAKDGVTILGGNFSSASNIRIRESANNLIGGTDNGAGNIIANNTTGRGIGISGANAVGNRILSNRIFGNGNLGIDLGENGVTLNDAGTSPDADSGPNRLQNFPVVSEALFNPGVVEIKGSLLSTPNAAFTLQFYANNSCNASGSGEGEFLINTQVANTNASGTFNFSFQVPPAAAPPGKFITATATNNSTGDTSEFSVCRLVTTPVNGSLQFSSPTFRVSENASSVTVSVTRAGGTENSVSVQYATTVGGSAIGGSTCVAGIDYLSAAGTLNWAEGDSAPKTFTVTICDNTQIGGNKTVNLNLSNAAGGAVLGSPNQATLTVVDDEAALVVTNLNDGGSGSLRQAILDSNANESYETIRFAENLQGVITLQTQLPDLSNDIKINGPGARILTVIGYPIGGGVNYFKTFIVQSGTAVTISNLTISGGGAHNYGDLTINDCAIVNNKAYDLYEGGGVSNHGGTLIINRSTVANNNARPAVSHFRGVGGGVYNDAGRTHNSGSVGTVTINNSTISGNILGENVNGTADVGGGVANVAVPGTTALMYINNSTITNNNGGGIYQNVNNLASRVALTNTIVAGNRSVTQGDPYNFFNSGGTFVLDGNNLSDNYGSLTAGSSDKTGNPRLGTLMNNGGQTDTQMPAADSPANDAGRNDVLNPPYDLATDQRGQLRLSGNQVDIGALERQISDQDTASINNVTITEGNSGTSNAVFTVALNAPRNQISTFNFSTADGTATAGSDYVAQSGTLTIPPNALTGTISILVNGDTIDEPNENFSVNFSGVNLTAGGQGVGTISDDDSSTILIDDASITEDDSGTKNLDFVVRLSTPHTADVTMQYTTANGTARAGSDYVAKSGTLTIPAGATSRIVSIVINGDTLVENDETFFVNLSSANLVIADSQAVGTILNDDTQIAANMAITDAYAMGTASGAATKFTVTLSSPVNFTVTVNYATADWISTAGVDYTAASGTLTFNPGQTSKDVWIYGIKGDGDYATNKAFVLNLSGATNYINVVDDQGIGTISDVPTPGSLIFSEFRFRGSNGAYDEFIGLYNNRDYPITITGLNGDGGWSVIAVSPSSQAIHVGAIPLGTMIPARGHYLFANNRTDQQDANIGYSLGAAATPDQTYTADIQDGSGLALLHGNGIIYGSNGISQNLRQDTVGFEGGSNQLSLEGNALAPAGGIVESSEWSFIRRCTIGGAPQDTNDNRTDWKLISPGAAVLSSQQSLAGTPRPSNLASPVGNDCLSLSPTAAAVSISGRVISPQEFGLTNALVTLTDMQGSSRTILTGKLGFFHFTNVAAGEIYILSVQSKRYIYAPQVVTVNEDLTGLNFAPQ